jgi:hypothetical protein
MNLNNVSKCECIESVEISQEEIDALREAANAKAMSDNLSSQVDYLNNKFNEKQELEEAMNGLNLNSNHNLGSGISVLGSKKPPLNNKLNYGEHVSS